MLRRFLLATLLAATAHAQTPPSTKQTPPPGIQVPEPDRAELAAGVTSLGKEIESLRGALRAKPQLLALLPDVQVFHNAVRYALDYNEIFNAKQIPIAKNLLALGNARAKELRTGKPSWPTATGPVVRGYVSKIDGSVQPYGVIVPTSWKPDDKTPRPLSFWLHGGDPSSNKVLAKISAKLPMTWDAQKLIVGKLETSAADHAPILIFPNPLNPQRYVVLNSGFTFREGSNTTNSQQTPKLPDWAVIYLNTPPGAKWPGFVVDAGFFDERWRFPKQ